MDSLHTTYMLQHPVVGTVTAIQASMTVIPSSSVLPPSTVICIKNKIKLEYT